MINFGDVGKIKTCVYCIAHKDSGKKYIGVTKGSASNRWIHHISASKCSGSKKSYIVKALAKYGVDAFNFSVIEIAESQEQLTKMEEFWIEKLNTLVPNGYNLTTGGYSGYDMSIESREKISLGLKASWLLVDPEKRKAHGERMSITNKGREVPQHVRDAISVAIKGRKASQHTRNLISAANIGKKHSQKTRDLISTTQKGKRKGEKHTEDHILNKARARMYGKTIGCSNDKIYKSIIEASIDTGAGKWHIGSVCRGRRKTTKGLIFWYINAEVTL